MLRYITYIQMEGNSTVRQQRRTVSVMSLGTCFVLVYKITRHYPVLGCILYIQMEGNSMLDSKGGQKAVMFLGNSRDSNI